MWRHPRYAELTGRPPPGSPPAGPPAPSGRPLASFPRRGPDGLEQELRVVLDEYRGREYIALRLWEKDRAGAWWPVKGKGISVRLGEARGVADALARALATPPPPTPPAPARRERPRGRRDWSDGGSPPPPAGHEHSDAF